MENPELQKCDKECYINITNNYLEKIELLICTKNFFMKTENGKDSSYISSNSKNPINERVYDSKYWKGINKENN